MKKKFLCAAVSVLSFCAILFSLPSGKETVFAQNPEPRVLSTTATLNVEMLPSSGIAIDKGSNDVLLVAAKFTNAGTEDLTVSEVNISGTSGAYNPLNETNTTLFVGDTKIGAPYIVRDTMVGYNSIQNVGFGIKIPKGQSVTLTLKGDIPLTNAKTPIYYYFTSFIGAYTSSGTRASVSMVGSVGNSVLIVKDAQPAITVATPVFSPAGNTYISPQTVTISTSTAGAVIYYTTDGSTPTTSSLVYSAPLTVSKTTTLKAIAVKSGYTNSRDEYAIYIFTPAPSVASLAIDYSYSGVQTKRGESAVLSAMDLKNYLNRTATIKVKGFNIVAGPNSSISGPNITEAHLSLNKQIIAEGVISSNTRIDFNTIVSVPSMAVGDLALTGKISVGAASPTLLFKIDYDSTVTSGGITTNTPVTIVGNPPIISIDQGAFTPTMDSIKEGAMIRAKGGFDVYIVKYKNGKKFKRLILSPSVFKSYGHLKWEDIIDVDQTILDAYVTSEYVFVAGDNKVWKLESAGDTGKKIDVSAASNYDGDSVYEINATDRDSYVTN